MSPQLTQNFHSREFDCNDGTPVPSSHIGALKELCQTFLEPMRDRFGPCHVNSGFRTDNWNARIGGARSSFHVYTDRHPSEGVAADVRFARGTPKTWTRKARRIRLRRRRGQGGIGYYPQGGFIHIDNRDYRADWNGP